MALREKILSLARRQPTAENLFEAGLLQLMEGRTDASVSLLSESSRLAPRNASILNDLAAAYLAVAKAQGSAISYFHALASAERALRLDPNLDAARFNRALALESLGIGWEAIKAWGHYQAGDSTSRWADEARWHISRSRPRIDRERLWTEWTRRLTDGTWNGDSAELDRLVEAFRLRSRLFGEEDLLGAWADHWQSGDRLEADHTLWVARELGASVVRIGGDRMLADAVLAIDRAKADERKTALLVDAYREYREGLRASAANDLPHAAAVLSRSRDLFSLGGSPMSWWADVQLANSLHRQSLYIQAEALLRTVQAEAPGSYLNLHGRASWILGVIAVIGSHYDVAHKHYEQALTFYKRSGELESAASLYALISEYYYYIGSEDQIWETLSRALFLLDRVPTDKKAYILWCGSIASSMANEPAIAVFFQDRLVQLVSASGNPADLAAVLHGRATARAEAQLHEPALQDIAAAWSALKRVPRGRLADALTGDILLAESEIRRASDSRLSLARAGQALELFRRTSYQAGLPRALLAEARAYVAVKDAARASGAIRATLEEVNRQRLQILKSNDRIEFLAKVGMLFDEAARYHLSVLHRSDLAYGFVEHAQALNLLDSLGGPSEEWPRPEVLAQQLDPGVVVLQFGVLEDRTCVWALWDKGWSFHEVAIGQEELARRVELFRSAIFRDDRLLTKTLGSDLYRKLFGDVMQPIPTHMVEVIVPSKSLHSLPFAALSNPATHKYMFEEHVLELAPSTRTYLKSLESDRRRGGNSGDILLVGDPEFDHVALPTLKRLPGSAEEVRQIALGFGDRAVILAGRSATKRALLAELRKASILHLSAHAIVNARDPLMSYLALAPDGDSGLLFAGDLYGQSFGHLELVFLAGCATASGPATGNEGVMSLVRPFLASGASAVVGTLWDVRDRAASTGAQEFYRLLRKGMNASAALRQAQLSMIEDDDPNTSAPALWSAFVVVGAGESVIEDQATSSR
jgi:CHAT domain-containing protein/tetratricopeptide (TPR) repeat protein